MKELAWRFGTVALVGLASVSGNSFELSVPPVVQRNPLVGGPERGYIAFNPRAVQPGEIVSLWINGEIGSGYRWIWNQTYWQGPVGPTGFIFLSPNSGSYRLYPNLAGDNGLTPLTVGAALGTESPPTTTSSALYDPRTDQQRANAPKMKEPYARWTPAGPPWAPGTWVLNYIGFIEETPGHAVRPDGLQLEYDDGSGQRRTVNVEVLVNPITGQGVYMGNLHVFGLTGSPGRELFIYRRSNGDHIDLSYSGSSTQLLNTRELSEYRYDSLRNKVFEAQKGVGHFRFKHTNGEGGMGVRG